MDESGGAEGGIAAHAQGRAPVGGGWMQLLVTFPWRACSDGGGRWSAMAATCRSLSGAHQRRCSDEGGWERRKIMGKASGGSGLLLVSPSPACRLGLAMWLLQLGRRPEGYTIDGRPWLSEAFPFLPSSAPRPPRPLAEPGTRGGRGPGSKRRNGDGDQGSWWRLACCGCWLASDPRWLRAPLFVYGRPPKAGVGWELASYRRLATAARCRLPIRGRGMPRRRQTGTRTRMTPTTIKGARGREGIGSIKGRACDPK